MQMRHGIALILLPLLATCKSAPPSPYEFDKAGLAGMVYDLDGGPVGGLVVTLADVKPPVTAQTDVVGRFLLPEVPRGVHRVRTELAGYEPADSEISFLSRTQVLYLRVASLDQLVSRSVDAAERGEWEIAQGFLGRATALDPADARARYVQAAVEARTGRYEEAQAHLEALLAEGFRRPAVLLLLADVNEQGLERPDKAAEYLREYLTLRQDSDIEQRLARLAPEEGASP